MDKKQILALDSKKHVKIWLLHKLGMSRREIAEALGTNPGHVGNEIKAYEKNEDKRKAAESIFSGGGDKPSKEELKKIIDAAEDQMTKAVKSERKKQTIKRFDLKITGWDRDDANTRLNIMDVVRKFSGEDMRFGPGVVIAPNVNKDVAQKIKDKVSKKYHSGINYTEEVVKFSKGGVLVGKKHGDGGIKAKSSSGPLEVEGGEIIINAKAAKEHCQELSEINQSAGGGVAFPCDHPALDGIQGPMNGKGAKVKSGTKYTVVWVDRDYKEFSKDFYNDPLGPPENGLEKAKKFEAKLNSDDKKSEYGIYRSITIKITPAKIEDDYDKNLKRNENENKEKDNIQKAIFYISAGIESDKESQSRGIPNNKIAEGVEVEKEHTDLYNELSQRLEADGHKMPMSQDEFFRMITAAHIKEHGDYYPLLKKYVEHAPSLMDKPYYLLTKEEVIVCRDFIEMRGAAGMELTVKCHQRLKDLARYSMVKFNTLLKNLK